MIQKNNRKHKSPLPGFGRGFLVGEIKMKKKQKTVEFRFYEKPYERPALVLSGEHWIREYGDDGRDLHFHNMTEVGYCYEGSGEVIINERSIPYKENSFTFIPPNCPHTTISNGKNHWGFFYFDIEEIIRSYFKDNTAKEKMILTNLNNRAILNSEDEFPYLGGLIRSVFELEEKKGYLYKEAMKSSLCTALFHIMRIKEDVWVRDVERGNKIMPALEYIQKNYGMEIKIQTLAQQCNMSETHFRRLFDEEMNITPVEYINFIRIQNACERIARGDTYMGGIAEKVGYQSISAFNRNFKAFLGKSPGQWKKQIDIKNHKKQDYHVAVKNGWI